MQNFIIIFHWVQEIGPFSSFFIQNLELGKTSTDDKSHFAPLGLDLVNINMYAQVCQNIPNGLRVFGHFRELSGDKQLHKLSADGQV